MMRALLGRWKESKAIGVIEAAIRAHGPIQPTLDAARGLAEIGSKRSVPALCAALDKGPEALRLEAAAALAAVQKRCPDTRILEALNAAILHERQHERVRVAAVEALGEVVDSRHVGGFLEALKRPSTPLPVRSAAFQALRRLGHAELIERLVENYLFGQARDPQGAVRRWVVAEIKALNDKETLSKLHEIALGRRKLRHHSFSFEAGDPAAVVQLMVEVDPAHAVRYLTHMVDHSTQVVSAAAAKALREIRAMPHEPAADAPSQPRPHTRHHKEPL
ncbi:MAG: HEAT repeat domain-containing protein [Planctomycetes bacterium]|nr:HEAT repeat domain-containing protein [Planctomycetota bacterium]